MMGLLPVHFHTDLLGNQQQAMQGKSLGSPKIVRHSETDYPLHSLNPVHIHKPDSSLAFPGHTPSGHIHPSDHHTCGFQLMTMENNHPLHTIRRLWLVRRKRGSR